MYCRFLAERTFVCPLQRDVQTTISTYTKFRILTRTIAPSTKPPFPSSSSGSPLAPELLFLPESKWLFKLDLGLFDAILLKFPAKCVCVYAYGTLHCHIRSGQTIQIWSARQSMTEVTQSFSLFPGNNKRPPSPKPDRNVVCGCCLRSFLTVRPVFRGMARLAKWFLEGVLMSIRHEQR